MQTLLREKPQLGLESGPSRCNARVLTTTPSCISVVHVKPLNDYFSDNISSRNMVLLLHVNRPNVKCSRELVSDRKTKSVMSNLEQTCQGR